MYSFPHCFYYPSVIAPVHLTRCILSLHYLPGLWRLLIWCWCTRNIVSRVLYKKITHSISHRRVLFCSQFFLLTVLDINICRYMFVICFTFCLRVCAVLRILFRVSRKRTNPLINCWSSCLLLVWYISHLQQRMYVIVWKYSLPMSLVNFIYWYSNHIITKPGSWVM